MEVLKLQQQQTTYLHVWVENSSDKLNCSPFKVIFVSRVRLQTTPNMSLADVEMYF